MSFQTRIRLRALPALLPQDGRNIELQATDTYIQWRYVGDTVWLDLLPLSEITGPVGPGTELRSNGSYIQWSQAGSGVWNDLIAISEITGPQGAKGDQGAQGDPGPGVSTGGTTGQALTKNSNTDYDTKWTTYSAVAISGSYNDLTDKPTLNSTPVATGRLTLASGVPVPESDITGATTVYYTPAVGQYVPVYDGSALVPTAFAETSLPLDATSGHTGYHQSGKAFDIFAFLDGATFRIGTGPAWSSDTARGTGAGTTEVEQFQGFVVNKNSISLRFGANSGDTITVPARRATYLGSFYATANGQATDTKRRRLLFNAANRALRPLRVADPAANWTYSTATWRQANGNANNQVEVMLGLAGTSVALVLAAFANSSTTTSRSVRLAIGLDSTTARAPDCPGAVTGVTSASALQVGTNYFGCPGLGRHSLTWIEQGGGTDTQTWFGTDMTNGNYEAGMSGQVAI